MPFATRLLPATADVIAPDGSEVRVLVGVAGAGLAHFQLMGGATSVAVHHRSVEEMWYVISGRGRLWRRAEADEEIIDLEPGVSLTIPVRTHFQFRSVGPDPLEIIGVTLPRWPGDGEALRSQGRWAPTVLPGPGLAEPGD
jgi:mannose-6-phosphate isomerase-like protein (cupin superfamily)